MDKQELHDALEKDVPREVYPHLEVYWDGWWENWFKHGPHPGLSSPRVKFTQGPDDDLVIFIFDQTGESYQSFTNAVSFSMHDPYNDCVLFHEWIDTGGRLILIMGINS